MISLLLLSLLAQTAPADPLAPAREGKLQCVMPNAEKKTCVGITRYTPNAAGYLGVSEMLVSPAPLTTLEVRNQFTIDGDAVCNTMTVDILLGGTIRENGVALPAERAKPMLEAMAAPLAPYLGKKGCARTKTVDSVTVREIEIDGVVNPQFTVPVIWVGASEGYKLGV